MKDNPYLPFKGTVIKAYTIAPETKHFHVRASKKIDPEPGQFMLLGLWGYGEVPISVAGFNGDILEFTVRKAGFVTSALCNLQPEETLWLRGPYGRAFSIDIAKNRQIIFVAGGIGLAPLRPLIQHFVNERPEDVNLLYGARTPDDLLYKEEIEKWRSRGANVTLTVDYPQDSWDGHVGVVTTLWHEFKGEYSEAVAYVCGPPVMIRAVLNDLYHFGMPADRIITTLEAHMKCGIGKCGHCYNGPKFICTDGPVFNLSEIRNFSLHI